MHFKRFKISAFLLCAVTLLGACGDGSAPLDNIANKLNASLAALSFGTGLNSSNLTDLLFDANYLDGGVKKADLKSSLDSLIAALADTPELSLFPSGDLTNANLTDCDSNQICTLSATLTNKDSDDTIAVDFTTKVKIVGSTVYLYGDQSATAPI